MKNTLNNSVLVCLLSMVLNFSCEKKHELPVFKTIWEKEPLPVLTKGEPYGNDFYAISDCWVINDNGLYKMWYTGGGAVYPDTILHSSISYAYSEDGIHWTKYAQNPVLDVNANGWDSLGVETVTVIVDADAAPSQRYKMWYAGQTYNEYRYEVGYAYSSDGIQWVKYPGAVMNVGASNEWDNFFIEGPSVIKDGDVYKMWYAAYDGVVDGQNSDNKASIGYATSMDGISWQKYSGNPILLTTEGAWDEVYIQDPHVIKHNNTYHMWYGGADVYDNFFQQTGYAYSEDGIHWEKSNVNPILKRGVAGSWDGNTSSFPSVLIEGGKMKMWYTGKDVEPLPDWPTPYFWEIGYAEKETPKSHLLD